MHHHRNHHLLKVLLMTARQLQSDIFEPNDMLLLALADAIISEEIAVARKAATENNRKYLEIAVEQGQ
jgi:hypothetical protein